MTPIIVNVIKTSAKVNAILFLLFIITPLIKINILLIKHDKQYFASNIKLILMNENVRKILADNIRLLRAKKRFSQEAIAELASIGQNQVSEIENERANPNLETLIKIANALDVDMSRLFVNV